MTVEASEPYGKRPEPQKPVEEVFKDGEAEKAAEAFEAKGRSDSIPPSALQEIWEYTDRYNKPENFYPKVFQGKSEPRAGFEPPATALERTRLVLAALPEAASDGSIRAVVTFDLQSGAILETRPMGPGDKAPEATAVTVSLPIVARRPRGKNARGGELFITLEAASRTGLSRMIQETEDLAARKTLLEIAGLHGRPLLEERESSPLAAGALSLGGLLAIPHQALEVGAVATVGILLGHALFSKRGDFSLFRRMLHFFSPETAISDWSLKASKEAEAGRIPQAVKALGEVVRLKEKRAARTEGNPSKRSNFQEHDEVFFSLASTYFELAKLLGKQGQWEEAARYYEKTWAAYGKARLTEHSLMAAEAAHPTIPLESDLRTQAQELVRKYLLKAPTQNSSGAADIVLVFHRNGRHLIKVISHDEYLEEFPTKALNSAEVDIRVKFDGRRIDASAARSDLEKARKDTSAFIRSRIPAYEAALQLDGLEIEAASRRPEGASAGGADPIRLKPDSIDFSRATPVISSAQKFVIPVPEGRGDPLVYPKGAVDAKTGVSLEGKSIIDWQGQPIGTEGIVFFNGKDRAWQAVRTDGNGVIILNQVSEEQAAKLAAEYRRLQALEGWNVGSVQKLLTLAASLGLQDRYNSDVSFVTSKMTAIRPTDAVMTIDGRFGFVKRDDRDICQAVYVPRPVTFEGPAVTPQEFPNGAVIVRQGKDVRGIQPEIFAETYRLAEGGRPIDDISRIVSAEDVPSDLAEPKIPKEVTRSRIPAYEAALQLDGLEIEAASKRPDGSSPDTQAAAMRNFVATSISKRVGPPIFGVDNDVNLLARAHVFSAKLYLNEAGRLVGMAFERAGGNSFYPYFEVPGSKASVDAVVLRNGTLFHYLPNETLNLEQQKALESYYRDPANQEGARRFLQEARGMAEVFDGTPVGSIVAQVREMVHETYRDWAGRPGHSISRTILVQREHSGYRLSPREKAIPETSGIVPIMISFLEDRRTDVLNYPPRTLQFTYQELRERRLPEPVRDVLDYLAERVGTHLEPDF
jgi:tetratricopeptide (TPR) repeat protein